MLCVFRLHDGGHASHTRTWWRGASRRGLSRRGGARRSGRRSIGQREVVCALLEADDALLDVLRVRIHGRGHDLGEVVREEVGGVEARIARPIPPALPVFGTTGKEADVSWTSGYSVRTISFAKFAGVSGDIRSIR